MKDITLDALRAAGPDRWALVPVADLWPDTLLPILERSRGRARRVWIDTMRRLAEYLGHPSNFHPFRVSPYYHLSDDYRPEQELLDAARDPQHNPQYDLYVAIGTILAKARRCEITERTRRELTELSHRIEAKMSVGERTARWHILLGGRPVTVAVVSAVSCDWRLTTQRAPTGRHQAMQALN